MFPSTLYVFNDESISNCGRSVLFFEYDVFKFDISVRKLIVLFRCWNSVLKWSIGLIRNTSDCRWRYLHIYVRIIVALRYVIYASTLLYQSFTVYCSTYKSARVKRLSSLKRISMFLKYNCILNVAWPYRPYKFRFIIALYES